MCDILNVHKNVNFTIYLPIKHQLFTKIVPCLRDILDEGACIKLIFLSFIITGWHS